MPSSQPTVRSVPGASFTSRAQRLKAATDQAHRRVDARILGMDIFASRAAFARFVRVQHRLHADVQGLYACPDILQRLPSVQGRQRIALIERDLADLAADAPADHTADPVAGPMAYRLGWLYVVEGSALGGAVILKMAAGLGLHPHFGARHLAPAQEGVATAWRTFTAELDAIALDERQEALLLQGADAAFERVARYVADASD
ncbi:MULTISPECIES: biliverdin-producing heme oxygenase [unclassified Stenotrophomonas]|uniref:biliverdin-producing heme oxygenase n=1 Tax=unclassified Stenotrophomonas TaxID=196198 RepID=UPI0021175FB1